MNDRQLNCKISYLVSSLAQSLVIYNFKCRYNKYGSDTCFTKWISQSYYHYRSIYNEAWCLLDMYTLRLNKEHKSQEVFDQFPVYPLGMPLQEFQRYKYKRSR